MLKSDPPMTTPCTGAFAMALGAVRAGVGMVTGYPGAPVTPVINHILEMTGPESVHVTWSGNEKVAIETAFGASLGGRRSLLCVKSVGLNIALDPLMAFSLTGCRAGFVILLGDDPGGWGSQNEQDSRALALAAELPLLEPTSVSEAQKAVKEAFDLSETFRLPVLVRVTRAVVLAEALPGTLGEPEPRTFPGRALDFERHVVLPVDVVPFHERLLDRLEEIRRRFETSPFISEQGNGPVGILAAGSAYPKLMECLRDDFSQHIRVLRLGVVFPFPRERITTFLRGIGSVLILEENAPLVERTVRAVAQQAGIRLPVFGRETQHVPRAGELFPQHILPALRSLFPELPLIEKEEQSRPLPSRNPFCEGCPYVPVFDALREVTARLGGREKVIVVGDPGCMVRGQLPPYDLLDVKTSLGSSIAIAAGIAKTLPFKRTSRGRTGEGTQVEKVVALSGDSGFLHSGLNGLMDAARLDIHLLIVILDNGTTALSGGQPHPACPEDARGLTRKNVDLGRLAREAGAGRVRVVDTDDAGKLQEALDEGLDYKGVAVVITRGPCPKYS